VSAVAPGIRGDSAPLASRFGVLLLLLAGFSVAFAWADPAAGDLSNAAALLLASGWLFDSGIRKRSLKWHWVATILVLCTAWGILQYSTGLTVYRFPTLRESLGWLAAAAVFLISLNCSSTPEMVALLSRASAWFGGILSILTVLCWYTAGGTNLWIIPTIYSAENAGTFLNRDQYAVLMELLLPLALAQSIRNGRLLAPYCLAAAAMYASVLVTASKAGTILVTLELFVFLCVALRSSRRGLLAAATVAGCAVAVTAVFGPQYVIQRFQAPDLFAFRREMLLSSWQMIQEKWLTGFGLGTWPTVYPAFALFDPPGFFMNHAHNDWAEWTSDGGVLFSAALASVAIAAAIGIRGKFWSLGVSIAFVHALVDFPFHKPALVICVFLILGASLGSEDNSALPAPLRRRRLRFQVAPASPLVDELQFEVGGARGVTN